MCIFFFILFFGSVEFAGVNICHYFRIGKPNTIISMRKIIGTSVAIAAASLFLCSCGGGSSSGAPAPEGSRELITSASASTISISSGQICGYIDGGIYIYKGIPYAKASRFMEPQSPDSWEGVRSCRHYGPVSPHPVRTGWYNDESAFSMDWDDGYPDENCQNLNVWTPGVNDGKKRPVMVWLHGGGFNDGSSHEQLAYDGRNLAESGDVVVVSVNHRLNVLGFLDMSAFGGKWANSSNLGMKDIVKALEWVRDNISVFGGDPSNVTIFGQSGGGGKVSTLLATPSAKGLFHKAIVHSGSQARVMEQKYSRLIGQETARILGIEPSNIDEILSVPYEDLLEAGVAAIAAVQPTATADGFKTFLFGWAPTVDGDFLPSHPFDEVAPECSKDIPMMVGSTKTEFMMSGFIPGMKGAGLDRIKEYYRSRFGDRVDEYVEMFAKTYPDYEPRDLMDFDMIFRPMALHQCDLKVAQGGAPVYNFLFRWESPVLDGALRSGHCLDLPFAFNNAALYRTETGGGPEAIELARIMSTAWVNFARTGNPNSVKGMPSWMPYTAEDNVTMTFDNECEVWHGRDKALLQFDASFGGARTLH